MLTSLSIDGFKSFHDFRLELRPGLNVIVGPNGSGKTNIIRFLEFLAQLTTGSLVEAVSRSGGAGTIFRQTSSGKIASKISFSVSGTAFPHGRRREEARDIKYLYAADIEFSLENNAVYFSRQLIRMEMTAEAKGKKRRGPAEQQHVFDIAWRLNSQGESETKIISLDKAFRDALFSPAQDYSALERFIKSEVANDLKDSSFPLILRHVIDQIDSVSLDLVSGRAYNIDPNIVRQSEDIAGQPGIKSNGGGLAATLNAAKTAARVAQMDQYSYGYPFWRPGPRYDRRLISELANYSKLVNGDILDIDVEADPLENKLRVFLKLAYDYDQLRLPLSLASDGTVKWLALVAAVLTNQSVVAVEEPENFLHPYMQREIISIIRSSCMKSITPTFAIVTTHSETLINAVDPEELIIVSMHKGATTAVRPSSVDSLKAEIAQTGFGLGYYFLSGAVE